MALYQDSPMIFLIGGFDQRHFLDAAVALIYQLIPSSFFLCSPAYQFLHRYEFRTFLQPGSSLQISIAGESKAAFNI